MKRSKLFKEVKGIRSSCAPVALAAITGLSTDHEDFPMKSDKSMEMDDAKMFLEKQGLEVGKVFYGRSEGEYCAEYFFKAATRIWTFTRFLGPIFWNHLMLANLYRPGNQGSGHAVVYDPRSRSVIDNGAFYLEREECFDIKGKDFRIHSALWIGRVQRT